MYEHPMSERPIEESAYSSWLTPKTPTGGGQLIRTTPGGGLRKLEDQVENTRIWMTPKANEPGYTAITSGRPLEMATHLNTQASHWPTPHGMSGTDRNGKQGSGGEFAKYAQNWPTPDAQRASYSNGHMGPNLRETAQRFRQDPQMNGQESQNDTGRRLNPRFVEWLMGWPSGWLETRNFDSQVTG